MFVIRFVGLVNGQRSPQDGRYLKAFAFKGPVGEMVLETVHLPGLALQFPTVLDAMEAWRSVDPREPVRADGRPNRPLTAFTVEVVSLT